MLSSENLNSGNTITWAILFNPARGTGYVVTIVGHFYFSVWRRRAQKILIAILWTALWGGLVGGLAYFRPPVHDAAGDSTLLVRFRQTLDLFERWTLDWRLKGLGNEKSRSDAVIPVNIDDETIANVRESSDLKAAMTPWPRELTGELSLQMIREGASVVVLDVPLADISPHQCSLWGGNSNRPLDDDRLYRVLQSTPKNILLTFELAQQASPTVARELHPYWLWVGLFSEDVALKDMLRKIFVERVPAFVVQQPAGQQLWAGARSEAEAEELAANLGLRAPFDIQDRAVAGLDAEVSPSQVIAEVADVEIEGLNVSKLPVARTLEGPNATLISTSTLYGTTQSEADGDGLARSIQHLFRFVGPSGKTLVLPSWPLAIAMHAAGTHKLKFQNERLFIGDLFSIPMDERGSSILKWDVDEVRSPGKGTMKRYVPAWKFLTNLEDHRLRRKAFHHDNSVQGKVVVLSDTTSRHGKNVSTPVGIMTKTAFGSQALVNILRSEGIRRVPPAWDFAVTLGMSVFGVLIANGMSTLLRARMGALTYLGVLLVASAGFIGFTRWAMLEKSVWFAVVLPVISLTGSFLGATGYAAAIERKVRTLVQNTLGTYIPPEVARKLQRDLSLIQPEKRVVTVAFIDIRNFHRMSEKLSPLQVGEFLHEYFTEMSECVQQTQGQVDKFLGDALMAFWGAPILLPDNAVAGCEAVWKMHRKLQTLNGAWKERLGMDIDFHAALQTGEVIVGDMGTRHKPNYSVVGAAASHAFQWVAENTKLGTRILVGENTFSAASSLFQFRAVERFRRDSDMEAFTLYELLGPLAEIDEKQLAELAEFEAAMQLYWDGKFDRAKASFEKITDDPVSQVYIRRCEALMRAESSERWDGVFSATKAAKDLR